jgi:acyl carrier protein
MSVDPHTKIRDFVLSILARRERVPELGDGEALVTSGRLNSVEVIEIAVFLEREFGIDFSSRPFDPYEFDTVDRILKRIETSGVA